MQEVTDCKLSPNGAMLCVSQSEGSVSFVKIDLKFEDDAEENSVLV